MSADQLPELPEPLDDDAFSVSELLLCPSWCRRHEDRPDAGGWVHVRVIVDVPGLLVRKVAYDGDHDAFGLMVSAVEVYGPDVLGHGPGTLSGRDFIAVPITAETVDGLREHLPDWLG